MDANNKETISRLKFIGRIQIGDKINIKDMYLQTDGLLTQVARTIFQENRNKSLIFVQDTINKTFELLKCYDKSKKNADKYMCMNLITDLKNSKNGLINLKETYISDVKFVCDIDTILEIIEAKLSEIDIVKFSPIMFPMSSPEPPPPFSYNFANNHEEPGDNL
jgi:hypothetical protein